MNLTSRNKLRAVAGALYIYRNKDKVEPKYDFGARDNELVDRFCAFITLEMQ